MLQTEMLQHVSEVQATCLPFQRGRARKCFAGMQDLIDSAVFLDQEDTRIGTVIDVFDGTGKA